MRTAKIALVLIFCVVAGLKVKLDEATRAADQPLTIRTFAVERSGPVRTASFDIVMRGDCALTPLAVPSREFALEQKTSRNNHQ